MKQTFDYFPIETAPKDREIMVFVSFPDGSSWMPAYWDVHESWITPLGYQTDCTHWAEIEAMKPGGAE